MSTPNLRRQAIEARIQARHQLLKILYQWQITGSDPAAVFISQIQESAEYSSPDEHYFQQGWDYIINHSSELQTAAAPYMSRSFASLDPIERAVLWIGLYEITARPDIHPSVSIDQAIELAKQYGGEDSHKFINSVLDKVSKNHGSR